MMQEETSSKELRTSSSVVPVGYSRQTVNVHNHSPKSHTYDKAMLSQMGMRINAMVFTMGFENAVTAEIIQTITIWIKKEFGDLSMNEVIIAFEKATAHNLPGVTRHYKNFDMQYVGDVLNAYKSYRTKQLKIFKDEEAERIMTQGNGKGITGEQMYTVMKKIAMERGEFMRIADWSGAFEYCEEEGLIKKMTDIQKNKYLKKVIKDLEEKKTLVSNDEAKSIGHILDTPRSLQVECRKRLLCEHLQTFIDEFKSKEDKQ